MRKILTSSMIAGAALLVAACGTGNEANNTAENNLVGAPADPLPPLDTNMTDTNGMNTMDNGMNTVTTTVTTDGNVVDTTTTNNQ